MALSVNRVFLSSPLYRFLSCLLRARPFLVCAETTGSAYSFFWFLCRFQLCTFRIFWIHKKLYFHFAALWVIKPSRYVFIITIKFKIGAFSAVARKPLHRSSMEIVGPETCETFNSFNWWNGRRCMVDGFQNNAFPVRNPWIFFYWRTFGIEQVGNFVNIGQRFSFSKITKSPLEDWRGIRQKCLK